MAKALTDYARDARRLIKELPPVKAVMERIYERDFAGNRPGTFLGVYRTFEEAERAAPHTKKLGYDQPELATLYPERREKAFPSDYPVLFWLSRLLGGYKSVFDLGGHVGVSFYSYSKYLDFPRGLTWTVCDVPEITRAGEKLAQEKGAKGLAFTNRVEEADGCDLFLAMGSLQYIDSPSLAQALAAMRRRPQHLIVSKVPLYPGESFVTVQNTGLAFHAYRIFNRVEFIESIRAVGYRLVDDWVNGEQRCHIPFYAGRSIDAYSGLYFVREDRAP
jgi:putative methyltransferase (TIGR04325 family)